MQSLAEVDENETMSPSTSLGFGGDGGAVFNTPFHADSSAASHPSGVRSPPNPGSYPAQYNFARRTSVSAESLKPSADTADNWSPPFHQKTPDQLERLKNALKDNFLFAHLDDEQYSQVLGALVEKPIPAKDIRVIVQGDVGDYFYIVEKGSFDVYVHPSGSVQPGPSGLGDHVGTINAGGSFGELALMYNAPRAATVVSATPNSTLWALDRVTFRKILLESSFARRRMYEQFLAEVPLLSSLTPYERSKIADALESSKFSAGDTIIKEGDPGLTFYLVASGEAEAYKAGAEGVVKQYQKGDFFGELALLNDQPRAASVVAKTDITVAVLGKNAFQRMLGPVESIMRRTKYVGVKSGVEEMDPLQKD
ncbi:probable cAMP-dependent protein kinase regulatory subunit [Cephalotrichum gorgonifer]|uniref:cAMP-dependent protein kinase regulatory subunit n=1 Tax=Cephalotrichum gorgonifer TaxID=2041049 RepID=A0AAE8SR50_9PEZI|nr:probable cAMP-dependent protein kinase regulatory subunit [Cephalotrichum gorgonifer]